MDLHEIQGKESIRISTSTANTIGDHQRQRNCCEDASIRYSSSEVTRCRLTTRSSGPSCVVACAPRAPGYIVRPRRASCGGVRPLNASVRPPIPKPRSANDGLPLRFRGPGAAVWFLKLSSVQAVSGSVANRHPVCEASCVNRQRSCDYKVPRSRAGLTAAWRGSACSLVSASSSIKLAGVRRCLRGQASNSASFHRGPSFSAAAKGACRAKGLSQLRTHPACGSLTTRSTGRGKRQALVSHIGSRAGHRGR